MSDVHVACSCHVERHCLCVVPLRVDLTLALEYSLALVFGVSV